MAVTAAGIVAEYNPFHRGHEYHLAKTRESVSCDGIIAVMSGNFVQRGEPAIFNKSARAAAAVNGGADLVIELPLPRALSSAEGFAEGAVELLKATGIVKYLSFGSECGDASLLGEAAEALLSQGIDDEIKRQLSLGISYPAARQAALQSVTGKSWDAIAQPNNLLGTEYIKAIKKLGAGIEPVAIKRYGSEHDGEGGDMPSGSEIRRRLENNEDISGLIPEGAAEIFSAEIHEGRGPVFPQSLEKAMLSRLRMLPEESFAAIPDASEGLNNKIYSAVRNGASVSEIINLASSKRYAVSRIRRMLLCASLGVTAEHQKKSPPYIRVLAFNDKGRKLLHEMKKKASLPIITKPADVRSLSPECIELLSLEAAAGDFYSLGFRDDAVGPCGSDYRLSPRHL